MGLESPLESRDCPQARYGYVHDTDCKEKRKKTQDWTGMKNPTSASPSLYRPRDDAVTNGRAPERLPLRNQHLAKSVNHQSATRSGRKGRQTPGKTQKPQRHKEDAAGRASSENPKEPRESSTPSNPNHRNNATNNSNLNTPPRSTYAVMI